jgi:Glycosyltransferase family 87
VRKFLPESLLHASPRKRLWLGAAGVAIFIGTIVVGYLMAPKEPHTQGQVGLDFIAFYTAGTFVREGHSQDLYDLHAVRKFQSDLAHQYGVDLGSAVGPWWNPPFYAWTFVPLSKLSYFAALRTWAFINILCAAISAALLCKIVARESADWRTWLLIPVLMVLSTPFIHALSHAQNTCTSLLLVTCIALAWRNGRSIAAGLIAGLLFYKPQLAAALGAVLIFSMGWRVLIGLGITGAVLLMASLALPGSLGNFVHQMPANLHFVQVDVPYLWERHVTYKAFWRLLVQGRGAGDPTIAVTMLATLSSATVAAGLLWAGLRTRAFLRPNNSLESTNSNPITTTARRDRLIAATIAATPLLMPFYFDYDQLLLAVPATLFAADLLRRDHSLPPPWADRWLLRIWPAHFVWLMVNPDVALKTHLNLAVPLLTAVAALLIARAGRLNETDAVAEPALHGRLPATA